MYVKDSEVSLKISLKTGVDKDVSIEDCRIVKTEVTEDNSDKENFNISDFLMLEIEKLKFA